MNYMYDHGHPFAQCLTPNLDDLQQRVNNKKAALVIIDGGIGEGKTTFLVHCLDYINKINGLPPVDFKGPQFATGGKAFLNKLRHCFENKLPCIGYDEAGDFNKRGSLTKFNGMINRTFETFRAFKCIVFMSLPNFNVIDDQIFDKQIPRLLLHLKNRSNYDGEFRTYSLYRMLLLKKYMKKYDLKNYAYVKVHPNNIGHFLNLTPEREKELDIISTKEKINILKKAEVKIEGLMTYFELANKLFRSVQWVRLSIKQLEIKPTRVISRQKFFNEAVVNRLADLIEERTERPDVKERNMRQRLGL